MRVLIATDKFKGSMTSLQAGLAIEQGLLQALPSIKTEIVQMADGGDGFVAVLKPFLKTSTITVKTVDPLFRPMDASYEWSGSSKTAYIEMAVASGLVLLSARERNPLKTTTLGTGLLIHHAIKKGAKKIILGLGGSATNDGGLGIAAALGFVFLDAKGRKLQPIGASLNLLHTIQLPEHFPSVEFVLATDVNNPLFGKRGAAMVFARQKGASDQMIIDLDGGLRNLSKKIRKHGGHSIARIPGAGAAGGAASFMLAFFNYKRINGLDLIMEKSGFEKKLRSADLLITGEGKIDEQSLQGKLVGQLKKLAQKHEKKLLLVCGQTDFKQQRAWKDIPILSMVGGNISLKKALLEPQKILTSLVSDYFSAEKVDL